MGNEVYSSACRLLFFFAGFSWISGERFCCFSMISTRAEKEWLGGSDCGEVSRMGRCYEASEKEICRKHVRGYGVYDGTWGLSFFSLRAVFWYNIVPSNV